MSTSGDAGDNTCSDTDFKFEPEPELSQGNKLPLDTTATHKGWMSLFATKDVDTHKHKMPEYVPQPAFVYTTKDATPPKPYAAYSLPYIEFGKNCWKSYTVEGLTIAIMFLPVYCVLFPIAFFVQSLYMIPLHLYGFPMLVYRGVYSTLAALDSILP